MRDEMQLTQAREQVREGTEAVSAAIGEMQAALRTMAGQMRIIRYRAWRKIRARQMRRRRFMQMEKGRQNPLRG